MKDKFEGDILYINMNIYFSQLVPSVNKLNQSEQCKLSCHAYRL